MYISARNRFLLALTFSLSANLFLPAFPSSLQACQGKSSKLPNIQANIQANIQQRDRNNYPHYGQNGINGRDGVSQTLTASGMPVNLDLSGQDGGNGSNGSDASPPDCEREHYTSIGNGNKRAADGNNGENGGNGGSGGNGGNLTVYYTNLADLKNILVRSHGGNGGTAGHGGRGSYGCPCNEPNEEETICTGKPDSPNYKCKKKVHRCHHGKRGQNGQQGNMGVLSIIRGTQELKSDNPTVKVPLSQAINKSIDLSKNKWNIRNGASALLAPGSIIAEQYREFERRIEGTFQLDWNEQKSAGSFADQIVTLSLNDDEQIKIDFPKDLWVLGNYVTQGTMTKYSVVNTIRRQDVTKLKVADFDGVGRNVNLKLVDLGGRADLLKTEFTVKISTRNSDRFYDGTEYKAKIPPELVTRDYNRYIISLGKLPIPDRALETRTEVEIELTATRSLGERSAKQTIIWKDSIR
jgi:hypothetical protein